MRIKKLKQKLTSDACACINIGLAYGISTAIMVQILIEIKVGGGPLFCWCKTA
jgi:hypothetical protein